MRKGALALLLGLTATLGLAPVSFPAAFIVAFALFSFLLRNAATFRQAFALGWLFALGYHTGGLYWISASLFIDIARYAWVLPFSLLALPCYLALLFALAPLAAHPLRRAPLAHALCLAALVFFTEILRRHLLTGFPWNLFGYIWTDHLAVLQSAALGGIDGLTLLTLLCATTLGLVLEAPARSAWLALALTWGAFSGLTLWGQLRLDATPTAYHKNIVIRMVQAAVEQKQRRTFEQRLQAFELHRELSASPAKKPFTHLIWPETAAPFFLASDQGARKKLAGLVPSGGALITGAPSKSEGRYYNSLVVLDGKGGVNGVYDKAHLVPFGEFIPLRNWLRSMPLAADVIGGSSDFSQGPGPRTLRANGLPGFSPMICYEAIFSGAITDPEQQPEWLLQITNDAWFGDTAGPYQHLAMAKVRAIEEGLPLVRAANSGVSAVFDPLGRTLATLPLDARGVLDTALPEKLNGSTLFVQNRYVPAIILAVIFLVAGIVLLGYTREQNRPI